MIPGLPPRQPGGPTTVVVSPHLDDAVFSCGASVLAERAAGRGVLVVTLFSAGPGYERRRAEEEAATALLGVDAFLAGLPDAPFRHEGYRSLPGIVFGVSERDVPARMEAEELLASLLETVGPERVLAPLGVGRHVDHRIAFEAALAAARRTGTPLQLYEDRPYSLVEGAVEHRLREVGAADGAPFDVEGFVGRLLEAPYVVRHLAGEDEAREVRTRYHSLTARFPESPLLPVEPSVVRLPDAQLPRLEAAVASYASQAEAFFGPLPAWRLASRIYSSSLSESVIYAERTWRVLPSETGAAPPPP